MFIDFFFLAKDMCSDIVFQEVYLTKVYIFLVLREVNSMKPYHPEHCFPVIIDDC